MARLFIPGPTDVAPEILEAQARPMIGHRSQAFADLFGRIQDRLRQVLKTDHRVYVTASSGSGLQEAALRNGVAHRVLVCINGAFGDRWFQVATGNGIPADPLEFEWGQPVDPDQVARALKSRRYDALAVVHNETSTGIENPVAEIGAMARAVNPEILLFVDAVSSAGGVDIQTDAWRLDVLLTSSQKCFALPPGLAFAAVSDRVLERAKEIPHRGWYFDFLLLEKYIQRDMTPATPAISLLYALDAQLDRILAEGLQARCDRHQRMAEIARAWASERFALFAAEGHRSKTVTTVRNTRQIDVGELNAFLARHEMSIANGYGPFKDKTFRIGHMGEIQPADLETLLAHIDRFLERQA